VGIKLGVVVCDLGEIKFFYKAVVASSRVITVSAAQSNSQQFSYFLAFSPHDSKMFYVDGPGTELLI
jgi:hypothetical protein